MNVPPEQASVAAWFTPSWTTLDAPQVGVLRFASTTGGGEVEESWQAAVSRTAPRAASRDAPDERARRRRPQSSILTKIPTLSPIYVERVFLATRRPVMLTRIHAAAPAVSED
jgi:hypothetical protein